MKTVLLTRREIESLLDLSALLSLLREGFGAYSLERALPAQRIRSALPGHEAGGAIVIFPGLLADIPAYTVKVHAKFPTQTPAIKGVLLLHDLETGSLLALMDSSTLTAVRTGLAGALAAETLSRADASRVALIGAGVQGMWQLRSLMLVRQISHVLVYDTAPGKALAFTQLMKEEMPFLIQATDSLAEATLDADIIITATWSREPFLFLNMVRPGTHITTLGADEPGKREVAPDLLVQSTFVCDDRDLAVSMGAVGNVGLSERAIHAELGEVLAGVKSGRATSEEITIFGSVGLAFQDLIAAWFVYQQAQQRASRELDFLS